MSAQEEREKESVRRHQEFLRRNDKDERDALRRHQEHERESERRHRESMRRLDARDREARSYAEEARAYVEESKVAQEEMRRESDARTEELREFNREILLRNEKVYTALIAEIEEGRKQIQANTKAVLSVLDRLDGSGGLAA